MASFTCLACRVTFKDAAMQRSHYKSDWHRYNLKRKVAELPPVTHETFLEKVKFQAQQKSSSDQQIAHVCELCSKNFLSKNAYENHVKSRKHRDLATNVVKKLVDGNVPGAKLVVRTKPVKKIVSKPNTSSGSSGDLVMEDMMGSANTDDDDDDEWEDVDSDDEEEVSGGEEEEEETDALPPTACLFCSHNSTSLEENIRHMAKSHSFFVPDVDYVTDLEALMTYLGSKVGDGKVCLWCNRHSKQFLTVRACQSHMTDKGHCTLDYEGDAALEYADFYDFSSSYPDAESVGDDASELDSELSHGMNELEVDPDTLELILPSGARAGHRSLKHIYNQSAPPECLQRQRRAMIAGVGHQYRALGWHGTSTAVATRKQMDATRIQNGRRHASNLAMGLKSNKLQMKYFRKQVMGSG